MDEMTQHEENLWEAVLDVLSEKGRLSRYYRVPRNEMRAVMKVYSAHTPRDLQYVFQALKSNQKESLRLHLEQIGEYRIFCMLKELSRSMKCWVETGNSAINNARSWPVAHA
jgi:hemerythrin superfamily protein